jgi:alkylation response protein AidB-like acyl-CoA dehydrogenase
MDRSPCKLGGFEGLTGTIGSAPAVFRSLALRPHLRQSASFLLPYTSTIAQRIVATVVAGAAKAALRDAKALVKGRTRTLYYANAETADEDPILQQTIGQIAAYAFVVETAVLAAAAKLDLVQAARDASEDFDPLSQQASLAAAKAKVVVDELTLKATTALFDVGGAAAATQKRNLDRHWRNARTLASHNPSNLKAQWIGNHELNGARLPDKGLF